MKIHLIAVGTRMPTWVEIGFKEYQKRFPPELQLLLHEVPYKNKHKSIDPTRSLAQESQAILNKIPKNAQVIALEVTGKKFDSHQLSQQISQWQQSGKAIALLVGGPEGLHPECLERADSKWSLSPLTLPHPLVRIIIAESLYRAWTILVNHPYHRA